MRAIMDHVPEGITVAFGRDAVIHSVSKHGLCLIAKSKESVTRIGAAEHPAAWQVYQLDRQTPVDAQDLPLTRACRGETVRDEELFIRDSTGRMFPVLCNAGPIHSVSGEVIGGIIAWRDCTRMHELLTEKSQLVVDAVAARAEADAANRAKDEFLAKLAHELRNPLSSVKGWTEVARRKIDSPVDVRRALDVIDSNTDVQRRLIEDLLDLNRIVSGSISVEKVALPLDLVVQRAVDAMRVIGDTRGVRLALRAPHVQVLGDPARLHQVFTNLLGNAIKFSPRGSEVRVDLELRGSEAVVRVTDHGTGLTQEEMGKVFEPFWQASTGQTEGGLGLGLAIVRSLTELHGGRVRLSSDGLGLGCVFEVVIPTT